MLLRLYTTSRPVQHSYWFFLGMLIPVVYLLGKIARLGLSKTSGGRIVDFFVSLWNGFMVWPASFRYLVLAVIVLLFFAKIWGNQFLGKSGEHWAAQELGKLPSGEYHVLNDLVLEDSHGLHQIDHVVVSPYGIYMVETKNYTGSIIGDAKYANWLLYVGGQKRKIHSPLRQNYGHIKCLQELLKLDESAFVSIVCFANRTKTKVTVHSDREFVVHTDTLRSAVLDHPQCSGLDAESIVQNLQSFNITDKKIRRQHVKQLRAAHR